MTVEKFKTFKEAEEALWCFHPDEKYYKKVRQLFALAGHFYKPACKRGIRKYKTIQDANKDISFP